ncbi:MAG: hypothetical protein JWP44_4873, partial [Mucilaginibacter sp.]|nr:hypothetical protein [Mucilaginibacter sp.]
MATYLFVPCSNLTRMQYGATLVHVWPFRHFGFWLPRTTCFSFSTLRFTPPVCITFPRTIMPRVPVDLEQYKAQILDLQSSGVNHETILNFVRDLGITISLRTLQRRI